MELVATAVEITKNLWKPVKKHTGYLKHFQENVEDLSKKANDLEARRTHLENVVGYIREEEVIRQIRQWIGEAMEMESKARKIEETAKEMKKSPILLYSTSKAAWKLADGIAKHREVGEFEKLTLPSLTPAVIEEAAPSIKGLSSVESTLKKVMDALGDEKNRIIGVWGMGGVGKTTVVKNLNNQLLGTRLFSKVIVVVVSKDAEINKVQEDIAGRLGLTLKCHSSRASELLSHLKQEKRFLIILDDLWDRLDLDAVGIPSCDSLKDSKIILTTRKQMVCRKMETQIDIEVDVLQDSESWKLFREKAGDVVDDPAVHDTARKVIKECAGLPLAIITVGRALRGCRDSHVWYHVLRQLQESTPDGIEDMEAKVYNPIKLSYELLRPELKPGFLFCCLYPEDYEIEIDRMIKQWIGEGFLEDAEEDLDKTLDEGHSWVADLKASCLLLEGRKDGFVRMHDVVRDVGIHIAKLDKDYKSLVKTGADSRHLPRGLKWEEYKRMSLMRSKIKRLAVTTYCHGLRTLLVQENEDLEKIDGFLDRVETLRVLDLSSSAILTVPTSLMKLVNLRVLCLRRCGFVDGWDFSPIATLQQLECLDLSDNPGLKGLPRVIVELANLRSLDLTSTPNLAVVEQGIFSRLTQLEELKMLGSFDWNEIRTRTSGNVSFSELALLTNLSHLFVQTRNWMLNLSDFQNLQKFYIKIGHQHDGRESQKFSKSLGPYSGRTIDVSNETVNDKFLTALERMLMVETSALALTDCIFFTGEFPSAGRLQSLKYLSIVKCSRLEWVFKKEAGHSAASLDNLRYLELENLPQLRMISLSGNEVVGMLPNLTDLQVSSCDNLRHLFPSTLLRTMKNLTTIKVDSCRGMESLFEGMLLDLELGRQEEDKKKAAAASSTVCTL